MKLTKNQWLFLLTIVFLFSIDPMYAGPGGTIAKAFFKTWWGKIILSLIAIIFLPLIVYVKTIEFRKVRKNKAFLAKLSLKKKEFSWLNLEKEFSNIIRRVYNAWSNEDLSEAKNYMNHWYWQNQQSVFLEQWKRENLKNVSNLRNLNKLRPLYLEFTDENNFEGSRIAVIIDVVVEDYLKDRDSGKVIQGKPGYGEEEYIWFFEYSDGKWLLDEIQEGTFSLGIAKTPNVIPETIGVTV